MKIIISPFSQKLRNGKQNPKNYPISSWKQVISSLVEQGHEVVQIGVAGEEQICEATWFNMKMQELKILIKAYDFFISVDNFFPHFCNHYGLTGIVIFSKSDPKIFGYSSNINLLKDRMYLREDMFGLWESCPFEEEAFLEPKIILDAINQLLNGKKG